MSCTSCRLPRKERSRQNRKWQKKEAGRIENGKRSWPLENTGVCPVSCSSTLAALVSLSPLSPTPMLTHNFLILTSRMGFVDFFSLFSSAAFAFSSFADTIFTESFFSSWKGEHFGLGFHILISLFAASACSWTFGWRTDGNYSSGQSE